MSMISELIKELRRADNPAGGYYRTLYARAADTIEELSAKLATANMERSTAYHNGGWIPCSLAIPKPFNNVLVSYCDYSIGFMHLQYDNKWHDDDWLVAEPEEIIAWMPLPEPYKGE